MPAPTYVDGATGMQKGVANAEIGIKIDTFETTISDPKEYSFDIYGGHDGFAHDFNPSVTISITGEISSTAVGVPVSGFGAAVTFANETNAAISTASTFGGVANTGGFYPETISFSESRDGFRSMSITAISHPAIT